MIPGCGCVEEKITAAEAKTEQKHKKKHVCNGKPTLQSMLQAIGIVSHFHFLFFFSDWLLPFVFAYSAFVAMSD